MNGLTNAGSAGGGLQVIASGESPVGSTIATTVQLPKAAAVVLASVFGEKLYWALAVFPNVSKWVETGSDVQIRVGLDEAGTKFYISSTPGSNLSVNYLAFG